MTEIQGFVPVIKLSVLDSRWVGHLAANTGLIGL